MKFEIYQVGEMPSNWELGKVRSLCTPLPKSSLQASEGKDNGKYPFFTSSQSLSKRIDNNVYDGECLIFPTGGEAGVHHYSGKFGASMDCLTLKISNKKVYGLFLYYYLTSKLNILNKVGFQGTGLKHLEKNFLYNFICLIPPFNEQIKISQVLNKVDQLLDKTQKTIEEIQHLKKGLMVKILNRDVGNTDFKKTRLEEIPITWKIKKLGEHIDVLTDYHANGSYKKLKENVELVKNEDYAIMIRTTNLVENNFSDLRYISKSAYNFLAKSKVSPGDIVMNKIADPGTVFLVPKLGKPLSLGMNLFLIRTNPKLTNQTFVFYYLKQNENYIKRFTSGSTTKTITKEAVRNLTILVPPLDEQKKIVRLLSEIDSKLDNEKAYKSELEQLKKGLSQVLLTGKVRVKV